MNVQIGKCDDEVEVGCQGALWEREGEGGGHRDKVSNKTTTKGRCTSISKKEPGYNCLIMPYYAL